MNLRNIIWQLRRRLPEKAMAPHSSTLAWKTLWTEEPGRLQSMGSLRVGHDWATSLSLFTFMCWRRKWQPTPVFLPGESQGRGSLVGCHLWVAQSRRWLRWLSSSSSRRRLQLTTFILCIFCQPQSQKWQNILLMAIYLCDESITFKHWGADNHILWGNGHFLGRGRWGQGEMQWCR